MRSGFWNKIKIFGELRLTKAATFVQELLDGSEVTLDLGALAGISNRSQSLTVSGAVTSGVPMVELDHASTIVAATIATAVAHAGVPFTVKDTSASGTAAHTLTLTVGTFDGTNNTATLNAPDEQLVVVFDSAGAGTIILNTGSVALSSV